MLKKRLIAVVALSIILLSGCDLMKKANLSSPVKLKSFSSSSFRGVHDSVREYDAPSTANKPMAGTLGERAGEAKSDIKMPRKIVYAVSLQLEVKDVAKAMDALKIIASKNGGYLGNSSIKKAESRSRYGNATLRVPAAKLDLACDQIKKLGEVEDENKAASDITREYYDLKARLRNEFNFEKRLITLLNTKTNNVSSILEVERELARVRGNIESMQGTLRYYNNVVDLSTISISLYEAGVDLPRRANWLQSIVDIFAAALVGFFTSIGDIIIVVFAAVPWLAFLTFVIYLLVWLFKRIRGGKKEQ
ncbi:MAG: DUF4349 domain-containing protein [Candidatus Margulisbacteria bacterium]|nr:DUF4349 domain-containing protein [Candidatus Margulisiibacteriota bacterium]